jgi:hypothetical protein
MTTQSTKRTREHVFPKWLEPFLSGGDDRTFTSTVESGEHGGVLRRWRSRDPEPCCEERLPHLQRRLDEPSRNRGAAFPDDDAARGTNERSIEAAKRSLRAGR